MTQFNDLELIYNQFFNLTEEINDMIDKEDYRSAVLELKHKDNLVKKLLMARKTVVVTDEQKQKLDLMEKRITDNEHKILIALEKLREEVGEAIKITKKKVKVSSAYSSYSHERQGSMIDISE